MRNRDKVLASGFLGLAMVLISMTCTNPSGGTATETGNVSGVVYNANGSPAANATVHFYPVSYNPYTKSLGKIKVVTATATVATLDSTKTDATGHYSVKLDSGSYNLLASGDSGQAFQDSIAAVKGATVHPNDTLRTPGSITGVIEMAGGGNPETVFIIFMGTGSVWFPSDTLGDFATGNMAPGRYPVRFLTTTPNYNVLDTTLTVFAGSIDTLRTPIQLQFNGIPVPQGLKIQYDSNMQVVTLIWNKPTTGSPVKGYEIYRKNAAYNALPAAINAQIVTDTVYHDSTGVQDSSYEYYVAAVDTGNAVGGMSGGVGQTKTSAYTLIKNIRLDSIGSYPIAFAISSDTTFYIAYNGPSGSDNSFVGVFDHTGHNTSTIGNGMFIRIYDVCIDSHKNVYIADPDLKRIVKFNNSNDSIAQWNFLTYPQRILIDSQNNIFVLSGQNPCYLTKFDTLGNILATDSAVPYVNDIGDMVLSPEENVVVKDRDTYRLWIFNNALTNITYYPFAPAGFLRGIDSLSNILIVGNSFNVNVYNPSGVIIATWVPNLPFDRINSIGKKIYVLGNDGNDNISVYVGPF